MFKVLEQKENENSKQYATRVLIYNIINMNLDPGEKIIESDLSNALCISRTPIREAILELSQKRIIDIHPKKGTYVSMIDASIVNETLELRETLETRIAKDLVVVVNDNDVDYLRKNIETMVMAQNDNDLEKFYIYDKHFHHYLFTMCGHDFWFQVYNDNSYQFDRMMIMLIKSLKPATILQDHRVILDALKHRNYDELLNAFSMHRGRYKKLQLDLEKKFEKFIINN